MLVTVGISLVVLAGASFLAAHKIGGKNKRKRQAVFGVMSFLGVLVIFYYIYLKASGNI